jgi:hypothetical protein
MCAPAHRLGFAILVVTAGGLLLVSPCHAQTRPRTLGAVRRFQFTDEREIKKDWKLSGQWRIEGQGVRLYSNKATALESLYKVIGDLELVIHYDISPRRELVVELWGEQLELPMPDLKVKGTIPSVARFTRKGDSITYQNGREKPTIVQIPEARRDQATAIGIRLDRKSRSTTARELFIRAVDLKATRIERDVD